MSNPKKDAFLRQATPALFASFWGVQAHKVDVGHAWKQAFVLADEFWDALEPWRDKPVEEQVWMQIVGVATTANLIAHGKDIDRGRYVIEGIQKAQMGWQLILERRQASI